MVEHPYSLDLRWLVFHIIMLYLLSYLKPVIRSLHKLRFESAFRDLRHKSHEPRHMHRHIAASQYLVDSGAPSCPHEPMLVVNSSSISGMDIPFVYCWSSG